MDKIVFKRLARAVAEKLHAEYGDKIYMKRVCNDSEHEFMSNPYWKIYFKMKEGLFKRRTIQLGFIEEGLFENQEGKQAIRYHILHSQAINPFEEYFTAHAERKVMGKPIVVNHRSYLKGNC